jgi:hypothetical protein
MHSGLANLALLATFLDWFSGNTDLARMLKISQTMVNWFTLLVYYQNQASDLAFLSILGAFLIEA